MDIDKAHARVGEALVNLATAKAKIERFYEVQLSFPRMYTDEEKRNAIVQLESIQFHIEMADNSISMLFDGPFTKGNKT